MYRRFQVWGIYVEQNYYRTKRSVYDVSSVVITSMQVLDALYDLGYDLFTDQSQIYYVVIKGLYFDMKDNRITIRLKKKQNQIVKWNLEHHRLDYHI